MIAPPHVEPGSPLGETPTSDAPAHDGVTTRGDDRAARRGLAFGWAPIPTAVTSFCDCVFVEVNRAFCDLVGYSEADLLNLAIGDVLYPEDTEPCRAEAERQLAEGAASFQVEQRLIHRDGKVILTRVTGSPVPDLAGRPRYLVSQIQDITPYRAAGTALRASEARLRLALAAADMAVWEWDAATGQAHRSPQMPALFGLPPEDANAPRARYRTLVHPDDHATLRAADHRVMNGAERYDATYRVVRPDGAHRWLRDCGEADRDADGRLLRVRGVTQDVTEGRLAEAASRASEARYRALVEQLPAAVYAHPLAVGEGMTYISPRVRDILGFLPEEVLARPGLFQEDVHPDDREPVEAQDARAVVTEEPFDARYRVRHADGRWVWVRDRAVVVRDDDGRALHWEGLLTDVTDEVEAEARLCAAKDAAEAASVAKDSVLRVVSHDLRTPLTAIAGYAELLGLGGPLTPQQEDDIAQILRSASQLTQLIDGVLDLARVRAGQVVLCPTAVDLTTLLEDVRVVVAPQAAAKGIALVFDIPAGLTAWADPLRARQIVLNLVGNAVKFTAEGWVRVEARAADRVVELSVQDTGIGIAPEMLPHVFDEFHQGDGGTTHRYGGAGLGLAIARRLAELHGGSLRAQSVPGLGSTFVLTLPAAEP